MAKKLTNEEFQKRLAEKNNNVFTDDIYHNLTTKMEFYCSKKHHWSNRPDKVLIGQGCPYCCGNKIIKGETDLWTLRPDVAEMLEDSLLGYKIGIGHRGKHNFICPDCGALQSKSVAAVCRYGFSCNVCSDGRSYPNRLMASLLEMLNVTYIPEFSFPEDTHRYDFYLPVYNIIIEMHGIQHYEEAWFSKRTLQEEQDNDKYKYEIAMLHNIALYIVVDCRESNFRFIWSNICNSLLSKIFDLHTVDVNQLSIKAATSLFLNITNMWKLGCGTTEIVDKLHINRSTVLEYLHSANDAGVIEYSIQESRKRSTVGNSIMINQYTQDGVYVASYCSAQEVYNKTGIDSSSVRKCCNHKLRSCHSFLWFNASDPTQPDKTKIILNKIQQND